MSPPELHSAGGIVLRMGARGLEALLVHMTRPDQWRLPKGKLRPGEAPEAAALREVREETGVLAEILCRAGETEHSFAEGDRQSHKRVTWFVMRQISPTTALADPDFDEAAWVPIAEAQARLAFETERSVVRRAAGICGPSR